MHERSGKTGVKGLARRRGRTALFFVSAVALVGCRVPERVEPVSIENAVVGPMVVAVAPAMNLSGSSQFDPNRFADLMASELSYADGVTVIPVSRVLSVLSAQGASDIESPSHALDIVTLLGADAILVFAVTEYDPYDPPRIGITGQLYGARPRPGVGGLDPVALSRQRGIAPDQAGSPPNRLLGQSQRVFDAAHGAVIADIKEFAMLRGGEDSPFGWRKYVVSQQHFIRYCCYATIRLLLNGEPEAPAKDGQRAG